MKKGMRVSVYKTDDLGDCTLGGISSKFESLILIGEGIPEIHEPTDDQPAVYLKIHMGQPIAVPEEVFEGKAWGMMGGNFVYSCDSRFREQVNPYPIRVHDRVEQ